LHSKPARFLAKAVKTLPFEKVQRANELLAKLQNDEPE
jgi:hypothetical protein